ncbi:MAG: GNAT family N-acetyltransferase, partial [Shewanella sp.]
VLYLRAAVGRPAIGVEAADERLHRALYWVAVRLKATGEQPRANVVAIACVYQDNPRHFAIEDFIVLPEYRHFGLTQIILERVLEFVASRASSQGCVSINAYGEDERLCAAYGFVHSHCANLGPNLVKRFL